MEDLDALLADLQSTTAHISSYPTNQRQQQQYPLQQQPQQQQYPLQPQPQQHQYYWDQQSTNHHYPQSQPHQSPSFDSSGYSFQQCGNSNTSFAGGNHDSIYQLQQRLDQSPTSKIQPNLDYPGGDRRPVGFGSSSQDYPGGDRNQAALESRAQDYPGGDRNPAGLGSRAQDYPGQVLSQTVVTVSRESYPSTADSSRSSTPPPLPPPPPSDVLDYIAYGREIEHPGYQRQTFQGRESNLPISPVGNDRSLQQQGALVRGRGERMSALSNNLSELDQLLQDLNSAQFMAELDRKSSKIITLLNYLEDQSDESKVNEVTVNGGVGKQPPGVAPKPSSKSVQRSSVDNLLDQLEGVEPQFGRFPVDSHYQELSTVTTNHSQYHHSTQDSAYPVGAASTSSSSSYHQQQNTSSYHQHQQQNTSTATRELDDLMMSLSEFKMPSPVDDDIDEPAYAKPVKSQSVSSPSPTSPHVTGPGYHQLQEHRQQYQQQRENGLEVMLGDLQSDMNRQGVNIKQKGVCAACQKPIAGQVIAALGKTWHVEHFVCAHCEEPLGTRNFYERDSKAYCETDYHHLFAPRCAYCNGPIVDKCITALEKMWHPEHFFCAQCGRPFGEEDFHEKNGKAYCRDDYFQMFAPKCGGCAQPIMENYISALNRQWHPQCFVCWECRSAFGAGSFFDYEGLPYCETHYHARKGSLCASCERPITGRCITAMFKKFHPEHFVCAFCLKQLNKGTFKEQNDKPYCHPCFVKLFG